MDKKFARRRPATVNEAIAIGRLIIDRQPLKVLEELRAKVSYIPGVGYVIPLGKDHKAPTFKMLTDCIMFHRGGDTIVNKENKESKE